MYSTKVLTAMGVAAVVAGALVIALSVQLAGTGTRGTWVPIVVVVGVWVVMGAALAYRLVRRRQDGRDGRG